MLGDWVGGLDRDFILDLRISIENRRRLIVINKSGIIIVSDEEDI
jgi:hypothetical protein